MFDFSVKCMMGPLFTRCRITDYLTNTNVQLGASYETSKKSTSLFNEGYKAAAKYINATPEEIGIAFAAPIFSLSEDAYHLCFLDQYWDRQLRSCSAISPLVLGSSPGMR